MRDLLIRDYSIYAFQKPGCCWPAPRRRRRRVLLRQACVTPITRPGRGMLDNLAPVALWAVISVGRGSADWTSCRHHPGHRHRRGRGILRDVFMNPESFQAGVIFWIGRAHRLHRVIPFMAQNRCSTNTRPYACVAIVLALRIRASLISSVGRRQKPPKTTPTVVTSAVARPVKSVARIALPQRRKGGLSA